MHQAGNSPIMRNSVFAWIALATGIILLIPLGAMRFSSAVNWDADDFIAMGILTFGLASAFVLVARRIRRQYWLAAGIVFVVAFLYLWAELAVGIFTNLGH